MAKIKHTKNELKAQREALARYERFLPTLELKKSQLVTEIRHLSLAIEQVEEEIRKVTEQVFAWVDVMAEEVDLKAWLKIKEIHTDEGNIAGIEIRIFRQVEFEDVPYDFFTTPLWVDRALSILKEQIARRIKIKILQEQIEVLQQELRVTIQRINLFEKVKIPETRENIRIIQIFLGDAQTAEVVRGKIAKSKIQSKREALKV
ncbi:MAG TPA: V-type ATP synthase subunit D [Candidatus Marinimicrobia bacterium]|jgi:V/A-type H+-transporting ATPase subunit D|nr:MAG: V-type ATP synthase subunit D [Candidatus Marinimicrobia bacterium ADurb.Bin030]HNZ36172.1 V-type ATP synthase subunit D [Candidatus Neomarinimicrobiota bacterium]HOD38355.1 V-type ATP synthase subunit D [Candidatus Neomarinimicrobiota bacterium]HOG75530.1 V-type ATP synthase subunit D [Candidatus Neomarinimicrobiota bacterium]HOO14598.1 V-type ATP synthase subunit D [Candidatus Neomarinimicrobiota bacterium]